MLPFRTPAIPRRGAVATVPSRILRIGLLTGLFATIAGATAPDSPTPDARDADRPPPGFTALFDGETLDGWKGKEDLWSVQDAAIVGSTEGVDLPQHPADAEGLGETAGVLNDAADDMG